MKTFILLHLVFFLFVFPKEITQRGEVPIDVPMATVVIIVPIKNWKKSKCLIGK